MQWMFGLTNRVLCPKGAWSRFGRRVVVLRPGFGSYFPNAAWSINGEVYQCLSGVRACCAG
ncbi:hypothetical protein BLAT2472_30253 [Burkholderia latens]